MLYQVVTDIKNPDEAKILLEDFLSKEELAVVTRRLAVAYFINKGKSYGEIKNLLNVSSTTIASIAPQIEKRPGYQLARKKSAPKSGPKIGPIRSKTFLKEDKLLL